MSDDSIWAETTDGGLLRQLFGYYPTLHDAAILSIDIDRPSDRIVMVVDYSDYLAQDDEKEFSARIQLEWSGIKSFELPLGDEDLLSLDFSREGDQIVTNLETWPAVFGKVVSDTFEAILVQIDPSDYEGRSRIRYR